MHIDQANVHNLKSLWEKYGSQALNIKQETTETNEPYKYVNTHWPHRCWSNSPSQSQDFSWLKDLPETTIFPVLPIPGDEQHKDYSPVNLSSIQKQLEENNWHCMLEQTAMFLSLDNDSYHPESEQGKRQGGFTIKEVHTPQDITLWLDIVTEAFGYSIHRIVIEKLINDQDMQILMAYHDEQAIASAILFKTDDVIGIHQVGVKTDFQGKGLARIFMKEIINACLLWQGKHIVLQASQAGKPLYESLGFTSQFLIKSYKQNES
jgi:ribosomal protein S18 acetylase RimI-like enzyme